LRQLLPAPDHGMKVIVPRALLEVLPLMRFLGIWFSIFASSLLVFSLAQNSDAVDQAAFLLGASDGQIVLQGEWVIDAFEISVVSGTEGLVTAVLITGDGAIIELQALITAIGGVAFEDPAPLRDRFGEAIRYVPTDEPWDAVTPEAVEGAREALVRVAEERKAQRREKAVAADQESDEREREAGGGGSAAMIEQAQRLREEAEERAEQLRQEAAERAAREQAEAEERAQRLREEAEERAEQLRQEAAERAAREQAEAEERAEQGRGNAPERSPPSRP